MSYKVKQKEIEDISESNALRYNQELKERIYKFAGNDFLATELSKVVLEELILSLNKSTMANKKMFMIKCLNLLNNG